MDRYRRIKSSWRATFRRSAASSLMLSLRSFAGGVGCLSLLIGPWVAIAAGLVALKLGGSEAVAAGAIFLACVAWSFGLLIAYRRAARQIERGDEAIRAAVDRADRQERRREEALAGGLPGQVSIAAPDAPDGALSPATGAGALSKKLPE